MHQFLSFTVSGLTTAAIYAIAASGLVLTYSTTGTFNFAHGATGMVSAFAYWQLRYGWGLPTPVAVVLTVVVLAPAFGAAVEVLIMRKLQDVSETTRLVVTLALLLGLLGFALTVWDPTVPRPVAEFFDGRLITVAGIRIPYHQVISLGVAVAVAVALRIGLYRTRTGLAMRAAVDDRSLAMLNGARPDRGSMLAWSIGSGLAAVSGVLVAPTLSLSALPLTLLIVNAYGAAIFGRLTSLPLTFVGAVVLGLLHDYGIGYVAKLSTAGPYLQGLVDAIPAVMLFVVLLVLPSARLKGRATRVREIAHRPPWAGTLGLCGGAVVATALLTTLLSPGDLLNVGHIWGIAIIGLSMVPLIGLAGQISLCQLSFAGIGAVVMAHLGASGDPLALVYAGLIAAAVGALVALPAIRLSGIYLALATGAFAVLMDRWIFRLPAFHLGHHRYESFVGGSLTIARPRLFGAELTGSRAYLVFGSVVFALGVVVVVALRRSSFGQRLIAMKESPAALATLGVNVPRTKLIVFTLSAGIAGVGGAVYGGVNGTADVDAFSFFAGLPILMTMVIAGISTPGAAVFAGLFIGGVDLIVEFLALTGTLASVAVALQNCLVGLAGIGLARNPNGFLSDLRPAAQRVAASPVRLAVVCGGLLGAYVATEAGILSGRVFVLVAVGLVVAVFRSAGGRPDDPVPVIPSPRDAPELQGLGRPYDRVALDAALHLPELADA